MSWADYYPILTDEFTDEFILSSTDSEKAELKNFYGVAEIFNEGAKTCKISGSIPPLSPPQQVSEKNHLLAISLCYPSVNIGDETAIIQKLQTRKTREGFIDTHSFWEQRIDPLFREIPRFYHDYPNVIFRVYLSANLHFLADRLAACGCEVFLMKTTPTDLTTGLLWKYLALGSDFEYVTFCKENIRNLKASLRMTQQLGEHKLCGWRCPIKITDETPCYYPINPNGFGVRSFDEDVDLLLRAWTWWMKHESRREFVLSNLKSKLARQDFDDWEGNDSEQLFLAAAIYPRLAMNGCLTLTEILDGAEFLALDAEYTTWANPNSELLIQE